MQPGACRDLKARRAASLFDPKKYKEIAESALPNRLSIAK
jgi:hypothetical protein